MYGAGTNQNGLSWDSPLLWGSHLHTRSTYTNVTLEVLAEAASKG